MSVRDDSSQDYLHMELAPSYGTLTKDSIKELDEKLKVMIAGTMKELAKLQDKGWDNVKATMMQNELIQLEGDEIARTDKLIKNSSHDFKVDGSADSGIVREVQTWFAGLVADEDVLKSTKIDVVVLGNIVAQTGVTVDSFEKFFGGSEHHSRTLVDIGVLRFPDLDRPFFKLYRIRLEAWSDSTRILFHSEDKNGITGEFNSCKFVPRASVMAGLTESAVKKAVESVNALLDD